MARRYRNDVYLQGFVSWAESSGRSTSTVYQYVTDLRSFCRFLEGRPMVQATHRDVREWLDRERPRLRRGQKPSAATVKRELSALRAFFRWAINIEECATVDPTLKVEAPTVRNEDPHPAPEAAWKRLWGSELELSDRVAFGLGLFCGLRRQEMTRLSATHFVDVPQPRLAGFARKGGKTGNVPWVSCVQVLAQARPDMIGHDPESFLGAVEELRRRRAGAARLLDWADVSRPATRQVYKAPDGHIDPTQANRRLKRALQAAGLNGDEFTPHSLRHSFCTLLLQSGVELIEVSRLAAHSSVAVTQRYVWTAEDPLQRYLQPQEPSGAPQPLVFQRYR